MSQPAYFTNLPLAERLREGLGRRATGIVAALAFEAVLVLLLLTLGQGSKLEKPAGTIVSTFDAASAPEQAPPEAKPEPAKPSPQQPPTPQDAPRPVQELPKPVPLQTASPTPTLIPVSKSKMADFDISNLPKSPAAPAAKPAPYGPANTGVPGDSQRVGTAPDGKPLYAAQWYRKPYDSELSGYLSTAQAPGWGQIMCKTAPEFRVEQCVADGEYPERSNIARSVLAAAWQFKVRPPRIGGRQLYGEWVRIRIYWGMKGP